MVGGRCIHDEFFEPTTRKKRNHDYSRKRNPDYSRKRLSDYFHFYCIIQCQRRFRSFPSTVLYSARGGSGASRPLYYTVPEEVPELPVHCIIQCQRRFRSFPSTPLYHTVARGGSGASRPLYEEVPEHAVHCIIQCERRFRSFPSTVFTVPEGGSGAFPSLYYTMPEEVPELPVHCIIQC